jgi:nucleoside-diphosphate-sugar epimerase
MRDFTYVSDVVEANVLASEAPGVSGRAMNVADGRPIDINTLADAIGDVLGRDIDKRYGPARPGDVRDSWADIGLGERLLGYEPRVTLDEGLRLTAGAFLDDTLTDAVAG